MTALDSNKVSFLQKIKELQDQIDALKAQEKVSFNWENAPVICELNGYRWILGQEADKELNWQDAKDWCKSVGGELAPRDILLQCYMNEDIKPLFKDGWYWSGTESSASTAWGQLFGNGNQDNDFNFKTYNFYVRAVRKCPI
jgi:hypothetical protein